MGRGLALEGAGRRGSAAPFTRGSPDVTVALFNYSHAYALNGRARVRNRPSASHAFSPTPAPHYVLRVCPPTGQRNHVESWRGAPPIKGRKRTARRSNRDALVSSVPPVLNASSRFFLGETKRIRVSRKRLKYVDM